MEVVGAFNPVVKVDREIKLPKEERPDHRKADHRRRSRRSRREVLDKKRECRHFIPETCLVLGCFCMYEPSSVSSCRISPLPHRTR